MSGQKSTQNLPRTKREKNRICYIFQAIFVCVVLVALCIYWIFQRSDLPAPILESTIDKSLKHPIAFGNDVNVIPKLVHQMWKDIKTPLPFDLKRWKGGCQQVNADYEFKFYYDIQLKIFVNNYYPQYLELFNSLKGVYMADMARVLLIYHHGGIYMDLDFYCHRPFNCMIDSVTKKLDKILSSTLNQLDNILLVPLEPYDHAVTLQNKTRIVIQDFYMASPKHPFLYSNVSCTDSNVFIITFFNFSSISSSYTSLQCKFINIS
jgi:hypothetical protein